MADRPGDPTEADVMAEIRDVHALVRDVGAEVRDERDRLAARLSEAEQLNETLRRALAEAQAFNAEGSRRLSVYEQALRAVKPFVMVASDTEPQHVAALTRARALMDAALTTEPVS